MASGESPLTDARYREINQALARLNKARLKLEAAKRGGVDVEDRCIGCDYAEQRLNQLKAEYFKGKP